MLNEKDPAPDFTLSDQNGKAVKLSQFRGKKVVLYFYPEDDTPNCTKEACSLRDGAELLADKNAVILGVSPDNQESHKKFSEKYKLPFTLLSDPSRTVLEAWDAWGEKNMYGHIVTGVLRKTYLIDEHGVITKIIKKVTSADHANQVAKFL